MHDTTAHLVDLVLPYVPCRQWVMSFPRYLRFQLARDPSRITEILRGFLQVVFAWQRRRARAKGIIDPRCGAVTFVQRFGGFVNLNVHFHAVLPDGVFAMDESGRPRFRPLDPPTDGEVAALAGKVIRRIAKLLARRDEDRDDDHAGDALAYVQAASVRATFSAPGVLSDADPGLRHGTRSAFIAGFSLHANVAIHENDRDGLERLCRYGLRPAFAEERLSWTDEGQIRYEYKRPTPNGQHALECDSVDFLARLAALIPPPRKHLTRYHGVFAPNHAWRSQIVPRVPAAAVAGSARECDAESNAETSTESVPATVLARRLDWAALLLHVFAIDVLECPRCQGRMRVLAFITEPDAVERILRHLGLPTAPPCGSRDPPVCRRASA
jgi:hypothetical protein